MNEPQVIRAALTDGEIHGLVRAAGLEPGLLSPLRDVADPGGDVPADARAALLDAGWLQQQPPGVTDAGRGSDHLSRPTPDPPDHPARYRRLDRQHHRARGG